MSTAFADRSTTAPLLFGATDAPLYGCAHAPAGQPEHARGQVVIAQPVLHEYMASHRTLVQLATRLALSGIGALRFDFHGAGDSAGENGAGGLERWQRDLETAASELAARAGTTPSVIGLRLGATIALLRQAEPDAPEVPSLVLWDPIVDGAAYLDELTALQRERLGFDGEEEVLGFPVTASLRADLKGLDASRFGPPRARRVLVVRTSGSREADIETLTARLRAAGAAVDLHVLETLPMWRDPGKAYVPRPVLDDIVSWLKAI